MKNVPRGLLIAILIGMMAGLILGVFENFQYNHEQLVFQDGSSISIVTEKIDFELGEQIHIKIINSGTISLTFSDASYGLKVTGLDGVLYYTPMAAQVISTLEPKEEKHLFGIRKEWMALIHWRAYTRSSLRDLTMKTIK
uniref:Uncharacterized protein n=1 Tax=uncultured marine thaumarchaeote AD1000_77_H06 TaxID=1455940 RepID=A0A075FX21_9ARCH|nr:hypothetical protein [uncultured marine thaumarchaeote AD1000_77_H06]